MKTVEELRESFKKHIDSKEKDAHLIYIGLYKGYLEDKVLKQSKKIKNLNKKLREKNNFSGYII